MQLGDGPGRVGGEINKRVGQPECVGAGVGRGVGVHEHDGPAPLQLIEQRSEARIAQVGAVGVAEQHDAVQPEVVEGVGKFGERPVDVRQRQAGEAAETGRGGRGSISAASSLHRRARTRAAVSSPVWTPGVLTEVTATSMPASSRNESVLARDQGGGAIPPTGWSPSLVARQKKSGQHVVVDVHGEGHGRSVMLAGL